jgi:hypothetical protein
VSVTTRANGQQAHGRLPNLVIAGVSKAGNTSLFHYLGQHPDIGTADVKEVRYFTPLRYGQPLQPLDCYAAHVAGCLDAPYALEATPGYFYGGAPLARGLDATLPGARVLVSLRAPVDRCWSWYGFVKSRLRIPKEMTFAEYVDRCLALHERGIDDTVENQPFWGVGGGCYAQWWDDWRSTFGDRLEVVMFEDLVADPAAVVRRVCDWLGLDTEPVGEFDFAVDNKTEQYRHRTLQKAAVGLNRRGETFFHQHQSLKRTLRRMYYVANRAPGEPGVPAEVRERLAAFYRPHNALLAAHLAAVGVALPERWGAR